MSKEEIDFVSDKMVNEVMAEFCETGLYKNDEPTRRGVKLDDLAGKLSMLGIDKDSTYSFSWLRVFGIVLLILLGITAIFLLVRPKETKTITEKPSIGETVKDLLQSGNNHNTLTHEQEKMLGVITPPEDAKKVTTVNGIDILELPGNPVDEGKRALIEFFLSKAPEPFQKTPPKAIVLAKKEDLEGFFILHPWTLAFASGPYMYLTPQTFEGTKVSGEISVNEIYKTFLHEWAHIIQFNNIPTSELEKALSGEAKTRYTTLAEESEFLADFATQAGWNGKSLGSDTEAQKTTFYGRNMTIEDQAESIAYFFVGLGNHLSDARVSWIERWSDIKIGEAEKGHVPLYEEAQKLKIKEEFLKEEVDALSQEYPFVSREYFRVYYNVIPWNELVSWYEQEIKERGFTFDGFEKETDKGYVVYGAEFTFEGGKKKIFLRLRSPERDVGRNDDAGVTYIQIATGEK